MEERIEVDVLVVGAGTAGLPCALEAAAGGARVLLVDKADDIGGTLHVSGGHLTGAGTRRQAERGIADHPDEHYDDVMRIGQGQARPDLLRLAVDLAAPTIDWLDELGFEQHEQSPRIVYGHEPYGRPRTHFGTDEARSILQLLRPLVDDARERRGLTLWLGAPVVGLCREGEQVVGATVERDGRRVEVTAAATVLATGGYAANPDLFRRLEGHPLYSVAAESSTGDGLLLAEEVGGRIVGGGHFIPTFGGLPAPGRPGRTLWSDRAHLVATERPPWEVYVDADGRRFVAEDEPSIDVKERRLLERVPGLTFHVVLDARGLRESGPLVIGTANEVLLGQAGEREGLAVGDSLEELAADARIDPDGLRATIAAYNAALADGLPDPLGREFRPAPIVEPPFLALRNHGATLITFGGVDVDDRFMVRDDAGRPVAGLYAVGEVLGAGPTMGNAFCGGMTLTPALAFGRALGRRLGDALGFGGNGGAS